MSEGAPHLDNCTLVMELLSKHDKPLTPEQFEFILSMLPGYPYQKDYLQETLRNFDLDKVSKPGSMNPPIYWHTAELFSGNMDDDGFRFALAVADSYQISDQGRFLLNQPMITTLRLGIERYRDRDHSVQAYYFYSTNGNLLQVDISDKSGIEHKGWITLTNTVTVKDYKGTMGQLGAKVAKLGRINLGHFTEEFLQTDRPFNLPEAFGIRP